MTVDLLLAELLWKATEVQVGCQQSRYVSVKLTMTSPSGEQLLFWPLDKRTCAVSPDMCLGASAAALNMCHSYLRLL